MFDHRKCHLELKLLAVEPIVFAHIPAFSEHLLSTARRHPCKPFGEFVDSSQAVVDSKTLTSACIPVSRRHSLSCQNQNASINLEPTENTSYTTIDFLEADPIRLRRKCLAALVSISCSLSFNSSRTSRSSTPRLNMSKHPFKSSLTHSQTLQTNFLQFSNRARN